MTEEEHFALEGNRIFAVYTNQKMDERIGWICRTAILYGMGDGWVACRDLRNPGWTQSFAKRRIAVEHLMGMRNIEYFGGEDE